jgi:hypothetical protein
VKEFGKGSLAIVVCSEVDCHLNKNPVSGNSVDVGAEAVNHEFRTGHPVVLLHVDVNRGLGTQETKEIYDLTGYKVPASFQSEAI